MLNWIELSAVKTLASNLAQDVDGCSQNLSTLKQKLLAHTVIQSNVRMEHLNDVIDQNGMSLITFLPNFTVLSLLYLNSCQ